MSSAIAVAPHHGLHVRAARVTAHQYALAAARELVGQDAQGPLGEDTVLVRLQDAHADTGMTLWLLRYQPPALPERTGTLGDAFLVDTSFTDATTHPDLIAATLAVVLEHGWHTARLLQDLTTRTGDPVPLSSALDVVRAVHTTSAPPAA